MKFIDKVTIIVLLIIAIIELLVCGESEIALLDFVFINQIMIMAKIDELKENKK